MQVDINSLEDDLVIKLLKIWLQHSDCFRCLGVINHSGQLVVHLEDRLVLHGGAVKSL